MVSEGVLKVKIDRPAGIVKFNHSKLDSRMSDWVSSVHELLGLVEKTVHVINKENMVHGLTA
jgi:26S proteasome regulatory subunit N5